MDATRPFFDPDLAERVRETRRGWEAEAQVAFEARVGPEHLEQMRAQASEKLGGLRTEVEALEDALRIDAIAGIELPEPPPIPQATLPERVNGKPLIDSEWDFAEQSRRLIAHKAYKEVS